MTTITASSGNAGVQILSGSQLGASALTSTKTAVNVVSSQSLSLVSDTISFSSAALATLGQGKASAASVVTAASSQTTYYAQFFPTRPGTDASVLANGVTNPGAQTISSGLSPAEIATAARASMDAQYSAMNASGKPYDPNSKDGVDTDTLMSGLDRTALAAVSQNEGGLFTKTEQDAAQGFMIDQEGLAIGDYEGPVDLQSKFVTAFKGDVTDQSKADVTFLDKASSYEQSTVSWAMSRASAQVSYEWQMEGEGKTPENLDSKNPLAKLLASAMRTMSLPGRNSNNPDASTKADLSAEPWMQGFESELDIALKQTREMYGSEAAST